MASLLCLFSLLYARGETAENRSLTSAVSLFTYKRQSKQSSDAILSKLSSKSFSMHGPHFSLNLIWFVMIRPALNVCPCFIWVLWAIRIFYILIALLLTLGLADYFLFCLTVTCSVGLLSIVLLDFVIFCLQPYYACNAFFTYALYFVNKSFSYICQ